MPPRNLWGGLNALRRHIVSPSQNQGDRKTGQQKHDHKTQRPVWQFPGRKNRRTNLNYEPRSNDVSRGDAIDLSTLQLLKEAGHIRSDSAGWTIAQNLDSSMASSDNFTLCMEKSCCLITQ